MPTTGVVNGTLLRLYIGSNPVAYATVSGWNGTTEIRETIHKDSAGGNQEVEPGQKSSTVDIEGFYNFDGTNNSFEDMFDAWNGQTELTCMFSTEVSGDTTYSFSAYIADLNFSAPVEENSTWSGTLRVNGAITKGTVA